eukprot:XP_001694881.1 predicted protein [Chlamydomonas reinhardtii]
MRERNASGNLCVCANSVRVGRKTDSACRGDPGRPPAADVWRGVTACTSQNCGASHKCGCVPSTLSLERITPTITCPARNPAPWTSHMAGMCWVGMATYSNALLGSAWALVGLPEALGLSVSWYLPAAAWYMRCASAVG